MATLQDGKLFINGVLRDAVNGATFADYSPWTSLEVGRAADATPADVDAAIAAARAAFDRTDWSTNHAQQARILRRFVEVIKAHQEELGDIVRNEAGATLGLVHGPMVALPLGLLDALVGMIDTYDWNED